MGIRGCGRRVVAALGTHFHGDASGPGRQLSVGTGGRAAVEFVGDFMRSLTEFRVAACRAIALSCAALVVGVGAAIAQSGDLKAQDQQKPPAQGDAAAAAKDGQRKVDEYAEAAQAINGPAGNPECVWLGRRVVSLMWRDDLDTAFRHLDLYDRFGCPGGHIQAAFRCLTRFGGTIDSKVPDSLTNRVHACWVNPNAQPQPAAAATGPAPVPAPAAPAPAPAAPAPAK